MKHIISERSAAGQTARRVTLTRSLAALLATSGAFGCSVQTEPDEMVDTSESGIIGGSSITIATRRSQGVVDVNGCSGSLITPHWAMSATHCVDLTIPGNNTVSAPRTDGAMDTRTVTAVSRVGQSDISVLQLGATMPTWPQITTRTMVPNGDSLVGQNVTCYGRGATAYASPSGVTGGGPWRSLVRKVAAFDGFNVFLNADANGNNILAPGDSGGACFFGAQVAGVTSFASSVECVDATTDDTCKNTLTKIKAAALASTSRYANYINMAPSRTGTATFRPLALQGSWKPATFQYNLPGVALVNGVVQLRGAITTTGTDDFAFSLPGAFTPATDVYVPVTLCGALKGRLHIQPNGVTRVQTEAGAWASAQCQTSLEGASFVPSNAGFTQLALQNGWVAAPFSTRNPAVRLISGIVHFRGALSSGADAIAFTLPAGFRPPTRVYVPVDLCDATKGRLNIMPTGEVTIQAEGNNFSAAQCFTSLEGASFATSAAAWIGMTPMNGWTASPFSTRGLAVLNVGGVVRLQGALATTGTELHAFTLPAQTRPATLVVLPVDMCGGKKGNLTIQEDGRAFFNSGHPWSTVRCFASLEGVSYGL